MSISGSTTTDAANINRSARGHSQLAMTDWWVYIILSDDHSYYTGITTDVDRRFKEHCNGKKGAKYFNGRKPIKVVYRESILNRSAACKRESVIKKLSREKKKHLIELKIRI